MKNVDIIISDAVSATVFGLLGVASLAGACAGAPHQLCVAAVCAVVVWVNIAEIKKVVK